MRIVTTGWNCVPGLAATVKLAPLPVLLDEAPTARFWALVNPFVVVMSQSKIAPVPETVVTMIDPWPRSPATFAVAVTGHVSPTL